MAHKLRASKKQRHNVSETGSASVAPSIIKLYFKETECSVA